MGLDPLVGPNHSRGTAMRRMLVNGAILAIFLISLVAPGFGAENAATFYSSRVTSSSGITLAASSAYPIVPGGPSGYPAISCGPANDGEEVMVEIQPGLYVVSRCAPDAYTQYPEDVWGWEPFDTYPSDD